MIWEGQGLGELSPANKGVMILKPLLSPSLTYNKDSSEYKLICQSLKGAYNNNSQEAALAIMPSTTHPQKSAEPSLHERTHNKSSSTHDLPVTLPE